ncbi:hypothetical protein [Streptomyces sp. NPDC002054]|uniref:hypothetical protein n=1 Tax=Streptomyces sp. NPDC002054 TaxID=3154663 RepID=UPI00331849D3
MERRWIVWTLAGLVVAGAAVLALFVPTAGAWIVGAVLAGVAAAIAGVVTRATDRGLEAGRELVLGTSGGSPIVVSVSEKGVNYGDVVGDMWRRNVPVGYVVALLTVEAPTQRAVILEGLEAVVETRELPPSVENRGAVRSSFSVRAFDVDLDQDPPVVVPRGEDFPFKVSASDPERIGVAAQVNRYAVTWHVVLHWSCNGESGTFKTRTMSLVPDRPASSNGQTRNQ